MGRFVMIYLRKRIRKRHIPKSPDIPGKKEIKEETEAVILE